MERAQMKYEVRVSRTVLFLSLLLVELCFVAFTFPVSSPLMSPVTAGEWVDGIFLTEKEQIEIPTEQAGDSKKANLIEIWRAIATSA